MRTLYTKPIPPPSPSDPRAPTELVIGDQTIIIHFNQRSHEFSARVRVGKWDYLYAANNKQHLVDELQADIFRGRPRGKWHGPPKRKAA
jgi:hypothetical protein